MAPQCGQIDPAAFSDILDRFDFGGKIGFSKLEKNFHPRDRAPPCGALLAVLQLKVRKLTKK